VPEVEIGLEIGYKFSKALPWLLGCKDICVINKCVKELAIMLIVVQGVEDPRFHARFVGLYDTIGLYNPSQTGVTCPLACTIPRIIVGVLIEIS